MDHEKVMINSYEIKFPFKPYPLQKAYMNQVLSCVKNVSYLAFFPSSMLLVVFTA